MNLDVNLDVIRNLIKFEIKLAKLEMQRWIIMDKQIRKIEKENKKEGKSLKSLEKMDKKRDKVCKLGKKEMMKKKK